MRVLIRGRNMEVSEALKNYVEKKLKKLDKFMDNLGEAQVTLTVKRESHRIEVTIPINGLILRGEETTSDMYTSIDMVVEKLEKQIEKYKGRLIRRNAGKSVVNGKAAPVDDEGPKVVRTKRFAIKPMATDEAIMQMNLLGHSFFVYSNAETDQVNVVYRRKDGNYGLIEPIF